MLQELTACAPLADNPQSIDWTGTARFEILRCLGRGGMGTVYEAYDRERRQVVALKTLLRFDPAALYLFKQEFRTLAGVHHPNLVRLHEFVATEGERVCFSMELVRGTDLLTHVQKPGTPVVIDETTDVSTLHSAGIAHSSVRKAHPPTPPSTVRDGRATGGSGGDAPALRRSPADFDRLRGALRQLVEGVQALHAAGKLHRDIKPSNALVTSEGRVVLLDFGLATELPRVTDENLREEGHVVGSARYMAPEQAFEDAPTPASDWYSVGVILYEALVGTPPFSGSVVDVIQMKNTEDPRPPSECASGIPRDLDTLCRELLDRAPEKRPAGPEILRRLEGMHASVPTPAAGAERPSTSATVRIGREMSLVGRETHLAALRDAFEAMRAGRSMTVRVSGRAGMGKSTLLQHFLDGLVERGEAVVLRGRAYERESVPYKAVDSVIDALSRHLMHLVDSEATPAWPEDLGALARLFPVLRRVPGIGEVPDEPSSSPQHLRRRAFVALRDLLAVLAKREPLVVHIDDAQWGDPDSAALMLELVRHPHAPPVLFVLAHREEETQATSFLGELRTRWPAGAEARDLSVGSLEAEDARRLALALLGSEDAAAQEMADAVARESGGSPFLIEELSRSSNGRLLAASDAKVTLEQVVRDRLTDLPEDARRLVEVIAIGGRPLPVSTVGEAARVESIDEVVALLSARRFVRPGLRDGRETVEPVHDRIRDTIVAQLPLTAVRGHHLQLARVLEATAGADPEAVAVHLLGAGETERGARFAERAAEQAATKLAFDQAARLFRLTIETLPAASPELGRLHARLGEVLGWAGRSQEAGRAYLTASEGAPPAERIDLERVASEHLFAGGQIEEGWMVLRRVLANVGIQPPRSPLGAVFWLIVYKLRLAFVGLRFKVRTADEVRPADRTRIDALNVVALGLVSIDIVLAACMQARQLVDALRAGDRIQVLRAATIYGNHLASLGGPVSKQERALHETIGRLAGKSGNAAAMASSRGTRGVGLYLRGRWREARDLIDSAYANLPVQRAGRQSQAALYALYAVSFMGDLLELRRRHVRMLADAEQRGDLFTIVQLRATVSSVLSLAADDPETARRLGREALSNWTQSKFVAQHWQVMRSEVEIALYEGDGKAAYERFQQDARALKKSFLLPGHQYLRAMSAFVRGRAAIASAGAVPERRAARLAEARRLARRLEQERMVWTAPLAAILTAGVAKVQGDRAGATASLRAAVELAQAADMSLYATAARHELGLVLGGQEGAEIVARAQDDMKAQEIVAPARFAAMLVPGRWTPS